MPLQEVQLFRRCGVPSRRVWNSADHCFGKAARGVGFGEFVRVGLAVTLLTTAAAMAILAPEYKPGMHP